MYRKDSHFAPRRLILPGALAGLFALTAAPTGVHAQTATASTAARQYDLPAAPLAQTLDAIAAIDGHPITFDRDQLRRARGGPVKGSFGIVEAIRQALDGTSFVLNEGAAGALAVTAPATIEIVARRDQAETEFKADRSDTATRSGTSLHLVPGSVTLITSKVLESQQATDLTEALRNVSGMTFYKSPQNNMTFGVRGFSASSDSNGITDNSATARSVFAVERVEVLKGPQAILSGGDSLGGAVNIVVKKPQAETIRDLTVQYGSFGDKTIATDLSGAIGGDRRLTYRTVVTIEDQRRNAAGFDGKQSKSMLQALRWKDASTDFIASAEYLKDQTPLDRYTFARRDDVVLPVPDRLLGNRADRVDQSVRRFGYQLERKLGDTTMLVSRMQLTRQDMDLHVSGSRGLEYADDAAADAPLPDVEFFASRTQRKDVTFSGDHYLRFNVATGDVHHKISTGFNHTNDDQSQNEYDGDSVFVPVYSPTPYQFEDMRARATRPSAGYMIGERQRGIYVQDLLSYEKWNLLLNWRRTRYTTPESTSIFYASPDDFVFHDPATLTYHTSPGAGLVYQVNDDTSVYASYGEGFQPVNALACGGGFVPPNQTRNHEVGAKFDLLDSRLTLTTSAFSLQETNRITFDQINNCYNVRRAQRTRGVEFDAQGRLLPGLDAIFNYTYTQVRDMEDASAVIAALPRHKLNLWAVYKFQDAALKGFGVGLGVAASANSIGDERQPFTVPGGAQIDATLTYATGPWNASFGVKNVLDRTLYATTTSNAYVPVLPGRLYALTVKRSFK